MPLQFEAYQQRSFRSQGELESAPGAALGAQVRQTITDLPIPSLYRYVELARAEDRPERIDADTARQRITDAGLDGRLKVPDSGIASAALDILMQRKREEIRRQEVLGRAPPGLGFGAARLGAAFATSLLDPLNIAAAFVPIVGQTRYLRLLANAGGTLGRVGVRAGVGAIEGAAGAALLEPIIYTAKQQEQADYDLTNSLLNVAFGTVFGGGLHVTFGGLAAAYRGATGRRQTYDGLRGLDEDEIAFVLNFRREAARGRLGDPRDIARALDSYTPATRQALADVIPPPSSAAARIEAATPAVREAALRTAVAQAMQGKTIEVDPIIGTPRPTVTEFRAGPPVPARASEPPPAAAEMAPTRAGEPARSEPGPVPRTEGTPVREISVVGPNGESATISMRNPVEVRAPEGVSAEAYLDANRQPLIDRMLAEGRDGVMVTDRNGDEVYILASPDQARTSDPAANAAAVAETRAAADRQEQPQSDVASDVRASEAADRQIGEQPKGEDEIATQEAMLADELAELNDVARVAGVDLKRELEEFDEALANADTYGKAARAAALCGLNH